MVVPSRRLREYLADPAGGKLGWVLKKGAPKDVREEYKHFKESLRLINSKDK